MKFNNNTIAQFFEEVSHMHPDDRVAELCTFSEVLLAAGRPKLSRACKYAGRRKLWPAVRMCNHEIVAYFWSHSPSLPTVLHSILHGENFGSVFNAFEGLASGLTLLHSAIEIPE